MREVGEGGEGIFWFLKFLSTPRPRLWGKEWMERGLLGCLCHLSWMVSFGASLLGPFSPQTHPHTPALGWRLLLSGKGRQELTKEHETLDSLDPSL